VPQRPRLQHALIRLIKLVPAPLYQRLKHVPVLRPVVQRALDRMIPLGEMTPTTIESGPLAGAVMALQPRMNKEMIVGHYEPDVVRAVQRLLEPGDRSFDVGAHLGYMSLIMAKTVGPEGQVVSFEPDPKNRSQLTENIERNAAITEGVSLVVPVAVGKQSGTMSFARGETTGIGHLVEEGGDFEVEVLTLDEAATRFGTPKLVKVDVEGRELEAIQGAPELLRGARTTFLVEAHDADMEQDCRSWFESFGYVVDILPRSTGWSHLLAAPPPREPAGQDAG
jgi:FkbM family methyltransferase